MKNNYLIKNLDNLMDITDQMRRYQNKFMGELIHSSLLIAHDEEMKPILFTIDGKDYALIFSSNDEFTKAFPNSSGSAVEFSLTTLVEILKDFSLDGFILNVSTQCFYMTRELLKALNDLPSNLFSSNKTYTSEELKVLKNSINNHILEDFIKTQGDYKEFFNLMPSTVLFALIESDNDMDILESNGIIETIGLEDKYTYHIHNNHVALFTREENAKRIETSKFRYLSLVNFATLVHYTIKNELSGIVINPDDEAYVVPVEVLIENWSLINRTCWDERLVSANYTIFMMGD